MPLHSLNKLTLLDYPGLTAAAVFFSGCNFRCPYCHNSSLLLADDHIPHITKEDLLSFLSKRRKLLDGICITGGEPTLSAGLPQLLGEIKDLGYLIKLDTNGSQPKVLWQLISASLVDYIAMDIKTDLEHYPQVSGLAALDSRDIQASAAMIMASGKHYEFRTTIVKEYHSAKNMQGIAHWLKDADAYYLQPYRETESVLKPGLHCPSLSELKSFQAILCQTIANTQIRGID